MPKGRRSYRKRYRRRARKTTSRKYITKICKKVLRSNVELKHFYYSGNFTASAQVSYVLNPLYWISQGTGDGNRVGDKIRIKSISLRFNMVCDKNDKNYNLTVTHGMISTREQQHNGVIGPSYGTQTIANFNKTGSLWGQWFPDIEKHRFLKTRKFDIGSGFVNNNIAGFGLYPIQEKRFGMSLSFGKDGKAFQYKDDNAGYGKTINYYHWIVMNGGGQGGQGSGALGEFYWSLKVDYYDA